MSDNKSRYGRVGAKTIDVSQDYQLRDWSELFAVTRNQLKAAVAAVGPMIDDIEAYLYRPARLWQPK